MKNKFSLVLALAMIACTACHKLDTPVTTELTPDVFPQTAQQFIQAAGPTYISFRQKYPVEYWFMQSLSTDEAILPARGGNWYDGARYLQLHYHTWTQDNVSISSVWDWLSATISTSNQNLFLISKAPDSDAKNTGIAELRVMRALTYYLMMDLWGNIPVVATFGDTSLPATTPRKDVFAFIEKEVKAALPYLSTATGVPTYGRPNKYTGFALLAKMYLNSVVYTGQDRYGDAAAMCDSVILGNRYALESDYKAMFNINNGPQVKEFIFAIPYDPTTTSGYQFFARYSIHRAMRAKYSLPFVPSGAISTLPEYYAYYNEPGDVRNNIWLAGKQYLNNGSPLVISTTKKGYDEDYTGSDASTPLSYHLELTPNIVIKNATVFDAGNDEKSWAEGYRCNKFYPDSTSTTRNQGNDVPVFRYADILLMKAEAILRGAPASNNQTPLSLVNMVRTRRNGAAWAAVDLESLYAERCREFAWEAWHRNDMIRFGKFEGKWGYKTDGDINKRLYPIPTTARQLNPRLQQNQGY